MSNSIFNFFLEEEAQKSLKNGNSSIFFGIINTYPKIINKINKESYLILLNNNNIYFIKNILDIKPELYNYFFLYAEKNSLTKIIIFLNHYKFNKKIKNKILYSNVKKINEIKKLNNLFFL